jgi:2-phospho-L-lactate guanylyltransferase (CobY/MobA/RfbA family)
MSLASTSAAASAGDGRPPARARHATAARNLSLPCLEMRLPNFGFDVDEPEDLARLAQATAERADYEFLASTFEAAE